jgi:hypothetical protein
MFKKPSQKTITDAGITAVAFVAGAKVGDGIAAVMPESVAPYKKWGLAAAGIILAASISGTTTTAKAAQSAALGMAAKQICDEVTETLKSAVTQKGTADANGKIVATAMTDKFINAVVGHEGLGSPYALAAAWDIPSQEWDRPLIAEPIQVEEFNPDLLV